MSGSSPGDNDMPGFRNLWIGGLALLAGAALTVLAYGLVNPNGIVVSLAVTLSGGLMVLVGLVQWYRQRGPQAPAPHRSVVDIDLLIRSMVAVMASDRKMDEREVVMIEDVSAGLLGEKIARWRIEQMLDRMKGKNYVDQIARIGRQASPEAAELALKGAVWAGRADGALTDQETQLVLALADALGVSGHRLQQCIAEADHVFDRLVAHGNKGGQP